MKKPIDWYHVQFLSAYGTEQMALDEALLEWLRDFEQNILITRVYSWKRSTLSLGTHQKGEDILYRYFTSALETIDIVKRPTGGRAILHGKDISFSFVTNDNSIMRMTLDESYSFFTGWIRLTLQNLGILLQYSSTLDKKEYIRSPLCFETQTPSDLLTENGQKIAGSAQLRRHGALLQHGSAFLEPFSISAEHLNKKLVETIESDLGYSAIPLILEEKSSLMELWHYYQDISAQEAKKLFEKCSGRDDNKEEVLSHEEFIGKSIKQPIWNLTT